MRRKYFILFAVLALVLSGLACNLLGGGDDEGEPISTEQPEAGETTEPTALPEFEEAVIDKSTIWDMVDIKSYRGDFTMTFNGISGGEDVSGSMVMHIDYTSDPPAQYLNMKIEGFELDPDLAGMPEFEFYIMGDKAYMNLGDELGWMSFTNDPDESISDSFMSYQDFVDLPDEAKRKPLPESVNGVMAWHYVIDENDFPEDLAEYEMISADAWIAVDGGYLVKMDVTMSGTFDPEEFGDQLIDEGTMHIVFDMLDVNADFTIELPDEAAAAEDFSLDDTFGDEEWTRQDVPLPDDAVIEFAFEGMVQFTTYLSYEESLDFMLTQLEANGWTMDGEPTEIETSYFGYFLKEGETLTLMLDYLEDDGVQTSVMITIE
jgi:hypothetical protein